MQQELYSVYKAIGITEQELSIKDVCFVSQSGTLQISLERRAVSLDKCALFEEALAKLLPDYSLTFSYTDVKAEPLIKPSAVVKTKPSADEPLPESGILLGKSPNADNITHMMDLADAMTDATVLGSLVSCELKEGWGNKYNNGNDTYRVLFNITDYTNSISCSTVYTEQWQAQRLINWLNAANADSKLFLVRGTCKKQKTSAELTLYANDIALQDKQLRQDVSDDKRVELHLHSRMSTMDGITNLTEAFRTAKRWGHKALAITDHGVVQAFPEAAKAAKKTGVKAIFGVEGYLLADTELANIEGCYVVFDLETTGLKPDKCDILEIGAVKLENEQIVDRFHTFIDSGAVIPQEITKLTGISANMLCGAPNLVSALSSFKSFCEGCCLVAHNAKFDMGFIQHHGERVGIEFDQSYADTLMLSRYLLRDVLPNHKLDTICKHFDIDMGSHHRADDDAASCAQILVRLMELIKQQGTNKLPVMHGSAAAKEKLRPNHVVILASTQDGMRNLYKLISYSHLDHFRRHPMIPKSMLSVFRSGLIVGSACEAGELYRAILDGQSQQQLEELASYYDYLEIQPNGNNAFLVREGKVKSEQELNDINRRIVELAHKLNKPVAATGDVHFLEPEDAVYRKILMCKQGFEDAELQAPLYFKSTDEMLKDFAYLGEDLAKEVVITAPNLIADMCQQLKPFPDGTHAPKFDNADNELRTMATTRAHQIYGDPLPQIIQARLDRELTSIIGNDYSSLYLMAQRLVHKSLSDGYLVGSRGSVGSSFVATMAGITEVNPLSPHYVCPNCKHSDFDIDKNLYSVGVDMPDKDCPVCGTKYRKDGFEIPFEVFLGFEGDKIPDIDLNFSGEYQPTAHKYVEVMMGEGHAFRAGTISGVAEKKGYECVYHWAETTQRTLSRAETERLCKGCLNVKVTTGQHPGGIVVVPKESDIYDFTPIQYPADKVDGNTVTTHFDFHSMDERLVKLDILGHDDPTALRMLEDLTSLNPRSIPLDDPQTRGIFSSVEPLGIDLKGIKCNLGSLGVPEFGTGFVRQVLESTKPNTMEEFIRIAGLTHGTDVWLNNAEPLVTGGVAKLNEVLCTRDDIMNYLIKRGMDAALSFKIMESVRKGRGIKDEWEAAMKENGVPAWFIDSCKKIKYMFPRGHAVAYSMMSLRIAYYKVHYPLEFYAVYFTVRADAFDITRALGGAKQVEGVISDLEKGMQSKEASETKKDKELITILELVYEMNLRGIELLPIDIYKSDAVKFKIENGAIRPPFNSAPGVGANAAIQIVERRGEDKFISIQDFATRTGANSGVIAMLRSCGCFDGLPEQNQISLFDF